jgi:hypothetical protein
MAEEKTPDKEKEKGAGAEAPKPSTPKEEPVKLAAPPAFSRKGLMILGAIVVLEAVGIIAVLSLGGKGAKAAAEARETSTNTYEKVLEDYLKVERSIIDLGEIEVPITSTQPRAPRSIVTTVQVVITKELHEKLAGGGGGHGGGSKVTSGQRVLELNVRSILAGMMVAEGMRLLEPSAKFDLQRKAKDRLNNAQIDGDEDTARVLKILRGQVLQVIIDKLKPQSY